MGTRRKADVLLVALCVLSLLTMGCFGIEDFFGDNTAEREQAEEERLRQPPPADSNPNPAGNPEIVLEYTATDMQSLPVYRAALSTPIIVDVQGIQDVAFCAVMYGTREDDNAKIGNGQPGTIVQTSDFSGEYDQFAGVLTGTITHTYRVVTEATAEAVASTTEYSMTGTLEARRVKGTTRLEGTVRGPTATATTTFQGENASSPITRTFQIDWIVTGELPEVLARY